MSILGKGFLLQTCIVCLNTAGSCLEIIGGHTGEQQCCCISTQTVMTNALSVWKCKYNILWYTIAQCTIVDHLTHWLIQQCGKLYVLFITHRRSGGLSKVCLKFWFFTETPFHYKGPLVNGVYVNNCHVFYKFSGTHKSTVWKKFGIMMTKIVHAVTTVV
jgi:hypothetical protein